METAASQITYWAERIEQGPGRHKASVWVDDRGEPGYLDLLSPNFGFRPVSTSYTLTAKPEDVVTRTLPKIPVQLVGAGRRERKAWADVYSRAFRQVDHSYNSTRWMEAIKKRCYTDTDLQFYLGFKIGAGLGDYFPGQPSAVGQIIIGHGVAGLYSIGTLPEHRGKGFSSEIVTHLASEAAYAGVQDLYLVTQIPEFFQRLGFVIASQTQIWEKI